MQTKKIVNKKTCTVAIAKHYLSYMQVRCQSKRNLINTHTSINNTDFDTAAQAVFQGKVPVRSIRDLISRCDFKNTPSKSLFFLGVI